MMDRQVRPWTDPDLPAVRDVLRRSWESAYGSFIPSDDLHQYLESTYSLDALRRLLADPEIAGYVGVRGTEIVAMMRVRDHRAEGRTYVSSIYVVPEEQGKGWGHRLMSTAAAHAVASGRHEIWLGVMKQNAPALEWYRRHGFVADREEPFQMVRTTVQHVIGHLPAGSFVERTARPSGTGGPR
jgi:ribosomal protein S18 acetylase RimI-like enzyme